jgi:hypothetical protein
VWCALHFQYLQATAVKKVPFSFSLRRVAEEQEHHNNRILSVHLAARFFMGNRSEYVAVQNLSVRHSSSKLHLKRTGSLRVYIVPHLAHVIITSLRGSGDMAIVFV